MQLENKVVIVTGGASGIGGAISRVLVARGAKVVAVDVNAEAGGSLQQDLGENVQFILGDVSEKAVAASAVELAKTTFGGLDGLVNNAHASRQAMFNELTEEQWDLSFNTGFRATRQFMAAAYPLLAVNGGSVVNFGSGSAIVGQQTQAAYASAKEAIRGLSRVTANEWAKDNIRVNVVSPMALTAGVKAWSEAFPEMYQDSLAKVPLGRFGDPEADVAPIVAFLLSDDSRYMTGQTIMADGGANKIY
ncbi:oxidoreductase [Arthrobacter alpinus]|uniref:Oxidoreductase n=1 Tax=Arthrobacter alpinus TaxID=656366 RepID=A0A0M4RLU9_9MICC|nr:MULTISPECIES: SDR family oxidoreductase [Arthrobacter]ALE91258.1 oxidoreductase [Arthrobacter alpinus]